MEESIKPIAYYLPQYYPVKENDFWWGKGFTEWTNVTKARPLFKGHYQPRYPSDLGYYDLRVEEVREEQVKLARENGIYGFCYYHYWFGNGKRLLERPFTEVLQSGKPDFPFMLCWANQTWKGVWFGEFQGKTLIEQTYPGKEDYENHFHSLLQSFKDPRYIKVDGKPVFQVYMPLDVPDLDLFVTTFRDLAAKNGLKGIYLMACNVPEEWDPTTYGFDGVVSSLFKSFSVKYQKGFFNPWTSTGKIEAKIRAILGDKSITQKCKPRVYDYKRVADIISEWRKTEYDYFPLAVPDWDNSARSHNNSLILFDSTPEKWKEHFTKSIEYVKDNPESKKLVFIKSWNEWAEGNYLEPDKRWGDAYLKVVKESLQIINNKDL